MRHHILLNNKLTLVTPHLSLSMRNLEVHRHPDSKDSLKLLELPFQKWVVMEFMIRKIQKLKNLISPTNL